MDVSKVTAINVYSVHEVMTSSQVSMHDKAIFVRDNINQIKNMIENEISVNDFRNLMEHRHLQKFRPLKNSYTKRGDEILFAKSLNIQSKDVPKYVEDVCSSIPDLEHMYLDEDSMEKVKTYVYRHGTQKQVVNCLDYELKTSKDKLKTLYSTLSYDTAGVADYFRRPIHRMSNTTMFALNDVVNKHLNQMQENGDITEKEKLANANWALVQIYEIQNNSKFIQAIKTYKNLK